MLMLLGESNEGLVAVFFHDDRGFGLCHDAFVDLARNFSFQKTTQSIPLCGSCKSLAICKATQNPKGFVLAQQTPKRLPGKALPKEKLA